MIFIASLLTMRRSAPRKSLLFVEPPPGMPDNYTRARFFRC